ncbi:MAG TPA: energy transducer TonB [Bryobacteraceae bacterium]|nr:energy transducer TonB [Bryobacteraceae bacterium]
MFSAASTAPLTRNGPRPQPIAFSLLVHAGVLSMVVFGPPGASREPRSLYDQVIKPREHELVWYSFRQKLPEVSPPEMESQPAGAELKSPNQTIRSNPKQGERGAQMIWRPALRIKSQPELASPNILAFRLPLIPPPPPGPARKLFVPPKPRPPKPADPVAQLPAPPAVHEVKQGTAMMAVLAALENRPNRRNFVPPAPKPERRVAVEALPEVPKLSTALRSERVPLLAESMTAPLANKPQPRTFVPPAARAVAAVTPVVLPDAPGIAPQAANGGERNRAIPGVAAAVLADPPKPREFVLPRAAPVGGHGANGSAAVPLLEEAPTLNAAAMPSANVNVAVVGLNPAAKLNGPLPDSSRDAKFSVGPNANGSAGGDGSATHAALSVPGLLIRGATNPEYAAKANPVLLARAAPTSREALQAAIKAAGAAGDPDPPSTDIHLAPPPDPKFSGRDVYTLAVQMPNITSYVGSWIMWFAERSPQRPRGAGGLRPPVPLHKVDPKYQPGAISERVEGKVQVAGVIRADGHVGLVRILKSVDPRLDQSAEEALLKWEFEPAQRNGTPVEVDLVAEIPFLLAPQVKR